MGNAKVIPTQGTLRLRHCGSSLPRCVYTCTVGLCFLKYSPIRATMTSQGVYRVSV